MIRFLTKKYLAVVLFLLLPGMIYAQGKGSISGKITDQATGEPLVGVTVLLTGTAWGAVSDIDGNYRILDLPSHIYTITFKYLGYGGKSVSDVAVAANKNTALSVVMHKGGSQDLGEVTVTSTYKQESVNALYAGRKRNSVIADGISADQIRRSPDNNTAQVLQRVSGTSTEDRKFVVVRGLAARYNSIMMNEAAMPATEPDKKAFSFDVIPANLIDNVLVFKTSSPDQPGDAAGGTIRINTKDLPDRKFMSLSIGTGYQNRTTFRDFYRGSGSGKFDFLGFEDGSRSLPDAFEQVRSQYASMSTDRKVAITRRFANTMGGEEKTDGLPPLDLQFAAGNTRILKNGNKIGFTAAVNYGSSRTTQMGIRDQFLLSKEQIYHYADEQYNRNYNTGALWGATYAFGENKLSWKSFFSNEFESVFINRTGHVFDGNDNVTGLLSLNNETTQNGLLNNVLSGKHAFRSGALNVSWDAAYGLSYRIQPDQRVLSAYQTGPDSDYQVYLSNENSPAVKNAGRIYSRLHENIYSVNVHFEVPFKVYQKEQKLRFGLSKIYRDRSFSVLALGYASALDPYGRGTTIALDKTTALPTVFSLENIDRYRILLANIPQNTKDYTGTADMNAGYLMFENYFSSSWRLTWGLRIENYNQKLLSVNQPAQEYSYTDFLPSANLRWSVSQKTDVRLAFSRTLNRPEFRELAAFRYYNYQNDFIISGNPDLLRSTNNNADFRIEHYPAPGEIVSVSVFYKSFKNPIEQINQGNNVLTSGNADDASDYGFEVEWRKRMDFFSSNAFFHNLIFYANTSLIRSRVVFAGKKYESTLQGQSPYLVNGGFNYLPDNGNLSFAVLYNRIGPRLQFRGENDGLDTYEKARDVLDFQVSKKVCKQKGELRLNISDILAQPAVLYYKYDKDSKAVYDKNNDKIISSVHSGTSVSISFTYLFYQ